MHTHVCVPSALEIYMYVYIFQVNATDADKGDNGNIVYTLSYPGGATGAFSVNPSTGVISLSRNLTQSEVGEVTLDLKAEDIAVAGQEKR